jgi:hypothetical protein
MFCIPPLTITDAILTSSTCAEDDYTEFAMATTYAVGDRCIVATGLEILTLDVAPASDWEAGDILTGQTSTKTCVAVQKITTLTYYVRERSGAFTLGEIIGVTGEAGKLADQGAAHPTITASTDKVHKVYESLAAGNLANYPPLDVLESVPKWLFVSYTNRWKMLDLLRNTYTESASPLTVVLTPGTRIDSLAAVGVVADTVQIDVTVGAVNHFSETITMTGRETTGWYQYLVGEFTQKPSLVRFYIPPVTSAVFTITFTKAVGNVKCGGLVLGRKEYIGNVQMNPEGDTLNFSTVTRDTFGNSELVPRRNVPKTSQTLFLPAQYINRVRALRDTLNAAPAVWAGLSDDTNDYFELLLILGYYRRFTISGTANGFATVNLDLEEI